MDSQTYHEWVRLDMIWPRDMVKYRIIARTPDRDPWSIIQFISGLVDVGRVHESAFVTRISMGSRFAEMEPGLVAVDFYAPVGWTPQPDASLADRDYYAGGPGTRHAG